ncbi:MAG TPA: thioredoxin domain-containing protein [Crocinitomicaceae bacterium]|nr:thioredoxin domain-containing protein [Flavobacteriales bacterium]HBW85353.1 thioredoxin domain-containing protein [Crocinitomicaceae bacterium]
MYQNALVNETSLYLKQHAHNPVEWHAWSPHVFEEAKKENKLVLVSIGYSACHWCHEMEKECFEDEEVAELMNKHFVCIKVDREERPDVDMVYMTAVQLMTQRGGWPLNCFTLPDGKPIYGGTYFPKDQWMNVLRSLVHTFQTEPQRVKEYADNLTDGITQSELIHLPQELVTREEEKLHELVVRWARSWDMDEGGTTKAPKFPLPSNYLFLLRYGYHFDHAKTNSFVHLTLQKIVRGGIYDQLGGGFARYSVDMLWKIPHFEKMLYDNAQLLELYAEAYALSRNEEYARSLKQTVSWLSREMLGEHGAFYSAIDADSEGEEGKFYCWSKEELGFLSKAQQALVNDYFSVNSAGYWEEEKYVLLRRESDESIARKHDYELPEFYVKLDEIIDLLFQKRKERIAPGIDKKSLCSWNAMLLNGLITTYRATNDDGCLLMARKIGTWIRNTQFQQGILYRNFAEGKTAISGFLEDYAFSIEAMIALYQATAELDWLLFAKELCEIVETKFQHKESKMCYFSADDDTLITRKMEIHDNVIPSTNSVMAMNFLRLGTYFKKSDWLYYSEQMVSNVYEGMEQYGSGYSHWANVLLLQLKGIKEVHVNDATLSRAEIVSTCTWGELIAYHREIPMSELYSSKGLYVCGNGICSPNIESIPALKKALF